MLLSLSWVSENNSAARSADFFGASDIISDAQVFIIAPDRHCDMFLAVKCVLDVKACFRRQGVS